MNNEPVAWMSEFGQFIGKVQDEICHIPLYTHPVNPKYDPETGEPLIDGYPLFSGLPHPVKELTLDDMRKVINETVENVTVAEMAMFLDVSKAILRKAQE